MGVRGALLDGNDSSRGDAGEGPAPDLTGGAGRGRSKVTGRAQAKCGVGARGLGL